MGWLALPRHRGAACKPPVKQPISIYAGRGARKLLACSGNTGLCTSDGFTAGHVSGDPGNGNIPRDRRLGLQRASICSRRSSGNGTAAGRGPLVCYATPDRRRALPVVNSTHAGA